MDGMDELDVMDDHPVHFVHVVQIVHFLPFHPLPEPARQKVWITPTFPPKIGPEAHLALVGKGLFTWLEPSLPSVLPRF